MTERLARFAARRPRAFVVAAPGGTAARVAVEAVLRRRAWRQPDGPVAADLLVVCGAPGTDLAEAIDVVWDDMPAPRARTMISGTPTPDEAAAALDEATDGRHGGHGGGHEGGHGHETSAPAEPDMADRAADRDGLTLDVLHVRLGPVLADWPAGLRVATSIQGDVIQSAEAAVLGGASARPFWDAPWLAAAAGEPVTRGAAERSRAAAHLDSLGRLLSVAGWADAARRAERLRDEALAGRAAGALVPAFSAFARRVGRSRSLRWMTSGLGVIDERAVRRYDLAGPAARHPGDVAARLTGWLTEAEHALARVDDADPLAGGEGPRGPAREAPSAGLLAVLPELLEGSELAAARLIVASLDPDADQLSRSAAAGEEAADG